VVERLVIAGEAIAWVRLEQVISVREGLVVISWLGSIGGFGKEKAEGLPVRFSLAFERVTNDQNQCVSLPSTFA
jgi:hypothetical protein